MSSKTEAAEKIIHALVYDVVLEAAIASATIEAPWLGLPVIKQIFRFVSTKLADRIYVELEKAAVFTIIDFETEKERKEYEKATAALKAIINMGSPDEIRKATEEYKRRLADLIRLRVRPSSDH